VAVASTLSIHPKYVFVHPKLPTYAIDKYK
jgi:hypothetical protein